MTAVHVQSTRDLTKLHHTEIAIVGFQYLGELMTPIVKAFEFGFMQRVVYVVVGIGGVLRAGVVVLVVFHCAGYTRCR